MATIIQSTPKVTFTSLSCPLGRPKLPPCSQEATVEPFSPRSLYIDLILFLNTVSYNRKTLLIVACCVLSTLRYLSVYFHIVSISAYISTATPFQPFSLKHFSVSSTFPLSFICQRVFSPFRNSYIVFYLLTIVHGHGDCYLDVNSTSNIPLSTRASYLLSRETCYTSWTAQLYLPSTVHECPKYTKLLFSALDIFLRYHPKIFF